MRPLRRLIVAAAAVGAFVGAVPLPLLGHNWGAGDTDPPPKVLCTRYPDYKYWLSECSANNEVHAVWFGPGMHADLGRALRNSITGDYDDIVGIAAYEDTTLDSGTDVQIWYDNYDRNLPIAFTFCGDGATKWPLQRSLPHVV